MVNSLKIAARFIEMLPKDSLSPETTDKREGYVHPTSVTGNETQSVIKFIIRDFYAEKLREFENFLKDLCEKTVAQFPGSSYEFSIHEQYRNMKYVLDNHPQVEAYAVEALNRLGIKPIQSSIRGGTDGSRLSFMGLPTPNLFAGGHNFHSYTEYVAVQDMYEAVKMIVTLAQVWEEKAE
jgi:tripeptide aminopeptidase